jgi:hypothetical protein
MTPETKKRHIENHDVIFNNTIHRAVPFENYKSREKDVMKLYHEHKGKKPDVFHGPNIKDMSQPSSSSGCYIATMVYGDYNHPQVLVLRDFRDSFLVHFYLGRSFIKFYYQYSPSWVKALENKKTFNKIIKGILNRFIRFIK